MVLLQDLVKMNLIDKLLHDGYSTISLGYIGLYEVTKLVKGVSHTDPKGLDFALRVMKRLRAACDSWKENTGIAFGLYGTPAESLCYRFARIDKENLAISRMLQIRVIILILTMLMFVKRLMLSSNLHF